MTRNIDELNNLTTRAVEPERYFGEMDLTEEQVDKRLKYTKKANELFDVILILLLTMRDNGTLDYLYARDMLEGWILSLINEFTTPDDYLIDYATDTAYNFIDTTKNHIDEAWYTSSDRALYNAENSANDVLNYTEYIEALRSGKTHKKWITEPDNRVRKTHKEVTKKPIPINELFNVGFALMRFPKDYDLAEAFPEELINCRCSIKYLPEDKKVEKNAESKQNRLDNNMKNDSIISRAKDDENFEENRIVRSEYKEEAEKISSEIDETKSLEMQARARFNERNRIKIKARDEMVDQKQRAELDEERPIPTFEEMVRHKMEDKGLSLEDAYRDIIRTASKTNDSVNEVYGV